MSIEIKGLVKYYDDLQVFENFNASIEEGKVTCIMGPSGCGKTTLLSILMGIEKVNSGIIKGLENKRRSAVFQEDRLCENLSALTNIRLVCTSDVSKKDILAALNKVGLSSSEYKPVRELSGGMKRRVAIVRALLSDFDILYLDEPFKGLDSDIKETVINFTKEKCNNGKTVIMVTHDQNEAESMGAIQINLK